MSALVRALREVGPGLAPAFGHKAATLGELTRAGFPVPAGFAISGEAFLRHAERALGPGLFRPCLEDEAGPEGRRARLARARRAIAEAAVEPALAGEVTRALSALAPEPARPVAVRSSATLEDRGEVSGAGVLRSILGVVGPAAVLAALREVWAGVWTEEAQSYRDRLAGDERVLVGVVVQLMVPAEAAGVLFTANPVTGSRDEIVVNCTLGLGEPVLSGLVTPDLFVLDKATLEPIGRTLANKRRVLVAGRSGLETVEPEASRRLAPSLTDEQVRAAAELGRRVERHFGAPRDVEFAVAGGRVHLLQARPITALPAVARLPGRCDEVGGSDEVWTNANVGDALPGVASPLTWSIAFRYSDRGFRRAFEALACEVPAGAALVGSFRGRIYLNLTQFLRIASQVPLLSGRSLAELAGSVAPEALEAATATGGFRLSPRFLLRLPFAGARLVGEHLALDRSVGELEQRVEDGARRLGRADLARRSAAALDEELGRVDALLDEAGDSMLTCAATSLATFLLVKHLVERWLPSAEPGLERELLAGAADLESAKPGIALWHLAEAIRTDAEASAVLVTTEPALLSLSSFRQGGRTRHDLEAFLAAYGHRAVREAELMTPRWSEEPTLIFATLREYLRSGGPPPGRQLEQRLRARAEAWERVDARLDPLRSAALRHAAGAARRYARLRERLRARVTQVLGLYRLLALEVGRRMDDPLAAFFLTIDEVHRYLRTGGLENAGALLAARRRQFEADLALPEPPSTFVGRPESAETGEKSRDRDRLTGLAASPGRATGTARVLSEPSEAGALRAGDVLVVACADVGWSPLFLLAGAVVTDRGGVLSHASVVAREYGVPAVVDVGDATRVIESGRVITVDGSSGLVILHS